MPSEDFHLSDTHLSDEEMLLAADGELPTRRAAQVRAHLAACWDCRARMAEVEGTIADFVRAHRRNLDPLLPPIAGPRALLRAQLAELTAQPEVRSWRRFFQMAPATRAAAFVFAAVFLAAVAGKLLVQHSKLRGNSAMVAIERGAVPDPSLTPGATRPATISDVCAMAHEDVVRTVPAPVRQEIFQEYGIANAHANDYEIDYLITPGLGGTGNIHNLWPESYTSPMWNAHVKDALEEHLHEMVCSGKLDLSTAQRDISTDWIAAYKKYFHTDRPLSVSSDLVRGSAKQSLGFRERVESFAPGLLGTLQRFTGSWHLSLRALYRASHTFAVLARVGRDGLMQPRFSAAFWPLPMD